MDAGRHASTSRRQIADPALRAKLTPDYPIGCKRILISDDYYQALCRAERRGRDEPDRAHRAGRGASPPTAARTPADTLIFAHRLRDHHVPRADHDRRARRAEARTRSGATAPRPTSASPCAGFPNLFLLYGPNTNLGHNSIIFMIECQVGYVVQCIRRLFARGPRWLDVRREAMDALQRASSSATREDRLGRRLQRAGTRPPSGKVTNNWSGFTVDYWRRTRRPRFEDFRNGSGLELE